MPAAGMHASWCEPDITHGATLMGTQLDLVSYSFVCWL